MARRGSGGWDSVIARPLVRGGTEGREATTGLGGLFSVQDADERVAEPARLRTVYP